MIDCVSMSVYPMLLAAALLVRYALDFAADHLDRARAKELPGEFRDLCDSGSYRRTRRYVRDRSRLDALRDTTLTAVMLVFLFAGGFHRLDGLVRAAGWPLVPSGLLFTGVLALGAKVLSLPLDSFETFRLEARYGFNRTTLRTFLLDELKSLLVTALLGAPLLALVFWALAALGFRAWLPIALLLLAVQVLLLYLGPTLLLPLFNRFTPLEDNEVRRRIESYARDQSFRVNGIFAMDGSRRTTKANAFFTGLGGSRRIVLYDTLLARHPPGEMLAVVAHEMGHYRKGHLLCRLVRGMITSVLLVLLMAWFVTRPGLYPAFGLLPDSLYAGCVLFAWFYGPLALGLGIIDKALSRRQEYEADAFAADTTGGAADLIMALKRLAVDHKDNLTPHPMAVWLHHGHPPVLERVAALRARRHPAERGS